MNLKLFSLLACGLLGLWLSSSSLAAGNLLLPGYEEASREEIADDISIIDLGEDEDDTLSFNGDTEGSDVRLPSVYSVFKDAAKDCSKLGLRRGKRTAYRLGLAKKPVHLAYAHYLAELEDLKGESTELKKLKKAEAFYAELKPGSKYAGYLSEQIASILTAYPERILRLASKVPGDAELINLYNQVLEVQDIGLRRLEGKAPLMRIEPIEEKTCSFCLNEFTDEDPCYFTHAHSQNSFCKECFGHCWNDINLRQKHIHDGAKGPFGKTELALDLAQSYESYSELYTLMQDLVRTHTDLRICSGCSTEVFHEQQEDREPYCSSCNIARCLDCGCEAHRRKGMDCDAAKIEFDILNGVAEGFDGDLPEDKFGRCPYCGIVVEKDWGCDDMTCGDNSGDKGRFAQRKLQDEVEKLSAQILSLGPEASEALIAEREAKSQQLETLKEQNRRGDSQGALGGCGKTFRWDARTRINLPKQQNE